jgi:hypothetical protein
VEEILQSFGAPPVADLEAVLTLDFSAREAARNLTAAKAA